jgi:hypothetical protein
LWIGIRAILNPVKSKKKWQQLKKPTQPQSFGFLKSNGFKSVRVPAAPLIAGFASLTLPVGQEIGHRTLLANVQRLEKRLQSLPSRATRWEYLHLAHGTPAGRGLPAPSLMRGEVFWYSLALPRIQRITNN